MHDKIRFLKYSVKKGKVEVFVYYSLVNADGSVCIRNTGRRGQLKEIFGKGNVCSSLYLEEVLIPHDREMYESAFKAYRKNYACTDFRS